MSTTHATSTSSSGICQFPSTIATTPRIVSWRELAAQAEAVAAAVDVSGHRTFQAQRRLIREELVGQGIAGTIDELVTAIVRMAEESNRTCCTLTG